jgi:hypothetical protein
MALFALLPIIKKSEYKLTLRSQRALRENILAENAEIAEEFNKNAINYTQ